MTQSPCDDPANATTKEPPNPRQFSYPIHLKTSWINIVGAGRSLSGGRLHVDRPTVLP